jgi:hypothetical protein
VKFSKTNTKPTITMATTQIADVYDPLLFAQFAQEAAIEKNAFLQSGIVVQDALIATQASGGGSTLELPQFNGLTNDEPDYTSDASGSSSTPANVDGKEQVTRIAPRAKSWSVMDLANQLALNKPVAAITGRQGQYWATDFEKRVINSCLGILADNIAADASDMLELVYSDVVSGSITDAMRISGNAVVDAAQSLGDHKDTVTAIVMHSKPHSDLQKLGLLVDNFDPQTGMVRYQMYLGYRVIVDDSMPVVAGSNSPKYTSILFGAGSFGTASAPVDAPAAIDRDEASGDGGGQTIIHSRMSDFIHPYGFDNLLAGASKKANSYAELANANRWDRVVDRKNVALAFLQTN